MTRVALATAWVWFALAEPAWASTSALELAEHGGLGMCADHGASDVDDASSGAETSRDAPSLKSVSPSTFTFALGEALTPAQEESPIAWCLTPDDPRCSRRDTGAPTGPSFAQPQLNPSGDLELPDVRVLEVGKVRRFWQLGAARPGTHDRLERPPRRVPASQLV